MVCLWHCKIQYGERSDFLFSSLPFWGTLSLSESPLGPAHTGMKNLRNLEHLVPYQWPNGKDSTSLHLLLYFMRWKQNWCQQSCLKWSPKVPSHTQHSHGWWVRVRRKKKGIKYHYAHPSFSYLQTPNILPSSHLNMSSVIRVWLLIRDGTKPFCCQVDTSRKSWVRNFPGMDMGSDSDMGMNSGMDMDSVTDLDLECGTIASGAQAAFSEMCCCTCCEDGVRFCYSKFK